MTRLSPRPSRPSRPCASRPCAARRVPASPRVVAARSPPPPRAPRAPPPARRARARSVARRAHVRAHRRALRVVRERDSVPGEKEPPVASGSLHLPSRRRRLAREPGARFPRRVRRARRFRRRRSIVLRREDADGHPKRREPPVHEPRRHRRDGGVRVAPQARDLRANLRPAKHLEVDVLRPELAKRVENLRERRVRPLPLLLRPGARTRGGAFARLRVLIQAPLHALHLRRRVRVHRLADVRQRRSSRRRPPKLAPLRRQNRSRGLVLATEVVALEVRRVAPTLRVRRAQRVELDAATGAGAGDERSPGTRDAAGAMMRGVPAAARGGSSEARAAGRAAADLDRAADERVAAEPAAAERALLRGVRAHAAAARVPEPPVDADEVRARERRHPGFEARLDAVRVMAVADVALLADHRGVRRAGVVDEEEANAAPAVGVRELLLRVVRVEGEGGRRIGGRGAGGMNLMVARRVLRMERRRVVGGGGLGGGGIHGARSIRIRGGARGDAALDALTRDALGDDAVEPLLDLAAVARGERAVVREVGRVAVRALLPERAEDLRAVPAAGEVEPGRPARLRLAVAHVKRVHVLGDGLLGRLRGGGFRHRFEAQARDARPNEDRGMRARRSARRARGGVRRAVGVRREVGSADDETTVARAECAHVRAACVARRRVRAAARENRPPLLSELRREKSRPVDRRQQLRCRDSPVVVVRSDRGATRSIVPRSSSPPRRRPM